MNGPLTVCLKRILIKTHSKFYMEKTEKVHCLRGQRTFRGVRVTLDGLLLYEILGERFVAVGDAQYMQAGTKALDVDRHIFPYSFMCCA